MNKQKISQALTTGLISGYGGKTEFTKTIRGGFELDSSHFQNKEFIYHDEWTNNGGQELVKVGDELFTRVYCGGEVDQNILSLLKITDKDISKKLKSSIVNFNDKTRLFSDFESIENDWKYEYKILDNNDEISVTTGKETIYYQNHPVFIHVFVLSPIKK